MATWMLILLGAVLVLGILGFMALGRGQGAESTLGVEGVELRTPLEDPSDLPGPGAEEAVAEPAERPDPHAQWDEVRGCWVVWDAVEERWVRWQPGLTGNPPPTSPGPTG